MSEQLFFKINGMKCGGCVSAIEKSLTELEGVETVEVDLDTSMASVKGSASADNIVAAIDAAGFNGILIPG